MAMLQPLCRFHDHLSQPDNEHSLAKPTNESLYSHAQRLVDNWQASRTG